MKVAFKNISKLFGQATVVEDLTLETGDDEFVVLLGPSGCGKTTTLRLLAGLEDATGGDIFIGGERVNDVPTRFRDIAMVFQSYALYPHMTVSENIAYPLRVRKTAKGEIGVRVKRVAEMLEIEPLLARRPRDLSGGERQRVALARAIIREPRVYLMDEPLSNLDAKLRVYMRGELKRLQRELGTTTVYVTHDQAEAMTLAHRVAVMRAGRLQQFDTPMNIYNRPANRFVAEFLGNPGMNFLEGRVDHAARMFVADGVQVHLSGEQLERLAGQDAAVLGVRPEHVHVSREQHDGWIEAVVHVTEVMGNETIVFLRAGGEKLIARASADFRAEIDSRVFVKIEPDRLDFFDLKTGQAVERKP